MYLYLRNLGHNCIPTVGHTAALASLRREGVKDFPAVGRFHTRVANEEP
jgi:hypothetical protein